MDDLACPRCKTTRYRNPSLKLMVNVCGHGLCENCVELLFVKGSGNCPQCAAPLRRNNFRLQLFEDGNVDKEVEIRKKILKDYNKKEEDFSTLRDYNDYLEEIEEIIFNLANNIDIESTKQKIEQYKKDNKVQIMKNKSRTGKEEEELEELIELEHRETECRTMQIEQEEKERRRAKLRKKEALLDDLMFSDGSARDILARYNAAAKEEEEAAKIVPKKPDILQFSTGIKVGKGKAFLPVPKKEEENTYSYCEVKFITYGPQLPLEENLETEGYVIHVRGATVPEKAGGFVSQYACCRALQDAYSGLFAFSGVDEEF